MFFFIPRIPVHMNICLQILIVNGDCRAIRVIGGIRQYPNADPQRAFLQHPET